MKVVTNIDTCRKSYEVIDSPFEDIRARYNELPREIKECFDTEEILNRSLSGKKITLRTLVNLWNNIKDIFLEKLDISEHLIDEYVLKYDLNKENVKAIIDIPNILDCVKKETTTDLGSFCQNYYNDIFSLYGLAEKHYNSVAFSETSDTGKNSEYKNFSKWWTKKIKNKTLRKYSDWYRTIEQMFDIEYFLTSNNRYYIDLIYPNLFVKTLRYWNESWDNINGINDIYKAFELKDHIIDTDLSYYEAHFIEKNFRFETISKVCDILNEILNKTESDKASVDAGYFTDLYLIAAIPNTILRNRVFDTYRQHFKDIWDARDTYYNLISYYSSYFIPTLSIIYKYHILKLVSNKDYEFSMSSGNYFSAKETEEIIVSKLRHKEYMSVIEQANLIKETMNIVTANNKAIEMEELIQELLELWTLILDNKEQYDEFEANVLSFINWMENAGYMKDTGDLNLNNMYERLSNEYPSNFFLLMFTNLLKKLKTMKKLSTSEKLIKEIAENIVVGYEEIAPFISNIIPLEDSHILYKMNRLLCTCDESIHSYKKSLFYMNHESNKKHDFSKAIQFNIFRIVFNNYEYSFIFDGNKYSDDMRRIYSNRPRKNKKMQAPYPKPKDKIIENYSPENIVEYLKEYIPAHIINNLPDDFTFYQNYIDGFPYNLMYGNCLSEEERIRYKGKTAKNKGRK